MRTLLRREFRQRESLVQVGALTLNTVTREVSGRGEPLPLTPREFAILEHLMLHRGCWISQEELMEHIWEADANPSATPCGCTSPRSGKNCGSGWAMIRFRPR